MEHLKFLEKRLSLFGNHYQKYLTTIRQYQDELQKALELSGNRLHVHLWRSSSAPAEEMKMVTRLSADTPIKIRFLSCYYAFQYLFMHFRNLDILDLRIAAETNRAEAYHAFMMQMGFDFRALTRAYMENLLDIHIPKSQRPQFCLCSVGTRADQDDIDVGIITDDKNDVQAFNRAMNRISQNMLVYATPLHHYLSEQVGKDLFSFTIRDFKDLLKEHIQNVVVISEIMNARFFLGSERLFNKLQKVIRDHYYYQADGENAYHEGFLRGILGEMRANLLYQPQSDFIAPKLDAIRMVKSFLYAKKSILGIKEVNAWDILSRLMKRDSHYRNDYEYLFKALSFLEIFRFFLQMHIIQEERFRIAELDHELLNTIASRMGYKPIGMVNSWDQVLIDYYRYVQEARNICHAHFEEINHHLVRISVFRRFPEKKDTIPEKTRNIHFQFIHTARFFEGTQYWEDVLDMLDQNETLLLQLIHEFDALPERSKIVVIKAYARWAQYSILTITRFINLLGKHQQRVIGNSFFYRLNEAYLQFACGMPKSIEWFCRIFSFYPDLLHQYFQVIPTDHFKYVNQILSSSLIAEDLAEVHGQLRELCHIHEWSSRYFHRFFNRIIRHRPEYLKSLTDPAKADQVASGLIAMVDIVENVDQCKDILGDYYDFEFLRCGIGTMKGDDLLRTNQHFTQFCDNYLTKLYDICSYEIGSGTIIKHVATDRMAILAAGGHARGQAYDDDYDLIALVDNTDKTLMEYATRIVSKMNREIVKRGLLPHYRLGEILGSFVNPIDQVVDYLSTNSDDGFIDLSQLLGSRMIIGSRRIKAVIVDKILYPFVFDRRREYISHMIEEIRNRHQSNREDSRKYNLKEARGGLRDIEATALLIKAFTASSQPVNQEFFQLQAKRFPELAVHLITIYHAAYYLRTIRNLYRITEAAEDVIDSEYLKRLSRLIAINAIPTIDSENIARDIRQHLKKSSLAIDAVINHLQDRRP